MQTGVITEIMLCNEPEGHYAYTSLQDKVDANGQAVGR